MYIYLQLIPAVTGPEMGYTLDRSAVHYRATETNETNTLTLTPRDSLESPVNLT